jgi:hypothetical protein
MPLQGSPLTYGVVSCHVERPLDDAIWARFARFQRSQPGGFRIAALLRPPAPEAGEPEDICIVFIVDPERQDRVREALSDLIEVPISYEVHGSRVLLPPGE